MPSGTPIKSAHVRPDTLELYGGSKTVGDQLGHGHAEPDRRTKIPDQCIGHEPQVLNNERIVETHLRVKFA